MADRAGSARDSAARAHLRPAEEIAEPESTPRSAHLEMVGAVLAGDGLERVAEIASAHAGAPVAVIVPRLGAPVAGWESYERYVGARLAGGRPQRPAEIKHGGHRSAHRGGRRGGPRRDRAVAAGILPEEALTRSDLDPADIQRRAARLGCDLSWAAIRSRRSWRSTPSADRGALREGPGWPGTERGLIPGSCPGTGTSV